MWYPRRMQHCMIFAACQLQEKCQEQNVRLYTTFIDLTKVFNTVCCKGLWTTMAKFGCPPKFIAMVRQFHDRMNARVQDKGMYSQQLAVTNGVKQGCVLEPTLFSMVFSAMLTDAFHGRDIGVDFRYHTNGKLFNPRRLLAKTKTHDVTAHDFLFADYCVLNASSHQDTTAWICLQQPALTLALQSPPKRRKSSTNQHPEHPTQNPTSPSTARV